MDGIAERCFRLGRAKGEFGPGLTATEIQAAESAFGFTFAQDHRSLLSLGMPLRGPNWRDLDSAELARQLNAPVEGAIFDVDSNALWLDSWGIRPADRDAALAIAEDRIEAWPKMVPIWRHRCMRAGAMGGEPVFSIMQTDCIFYGDNLAEWAEIEFGGTSWTPTRRSWDYLLPWSAFAFGIESSEL